jgi:hypothetical protein
MMDMKLTIRYIPLSQIKPDVPAKMTEPVRRLRRFMWDCMHVLAVRRSLKDGSYILISGLDRYEYLHKHTNRTHAPCIIDDEKPMSGLKPMLRPLLRKQLRDEQTERRRVYLLVMPQWAMIRAFLRQEPRFAELSRMDQLKVLLLAIRYRKTVVVCMRSLVTELLSK